MRSVEATPTVIEAAANAVVEFAIVSLQAEFLRWDKDTNLGIAEMIWNAWSAEPGDVLAMGWIEEYTDLVERLIEVRRTRWPDERVFVFGLDALHRDGGLFFRFDLTWDEGETFQPCEIEWVMCTQDPTQTN